MHKYYYDGPVLEFDFCVAHNWKATTIAPSEKKARCNLAYRYKMEHGMTPRAKVQIPGHFTKIEEIEKPNGMLYSQISLDELYTEEVN